MQWKKIILKLNYDLTKELLEQGNTPDVYSLPLVNMKSDNFKDFIYLLADRPNQSNIFTIENTLDTLINIGDSNLVNKYLRFITNRNDKTYNYLELRGYS